MKKIVALMLSVVMMISLCACGEADGNGNSLENDQLTIDAIAVDDSYVDDENDALTMVYLFYTVHAEDSNLDGICSMTPDMTINGENQYMSEIYYDKSLATTLCSSYYYDNVIEEIYIGDNKKMMSTFKTPKNDLEKGRKITLDGTAFGGIKFNTDLIKHYGSKEDLAQAVDPEGYQAEQENSQPADAETVEMVKANINDYCWTIGGPNASYTVEFMAENSFFIEGRFGDSEISNAGTYEVLKGYIALYYEGDTEPRIRIPYWFDENGEIQLDTDAAFIVA